MYKNLHHTLLFAILMVLLVGCISNPLPDIMPARNPTSTPVPDFECGDGWATAFAWEDLNLNGVHDKSEPPLEGVCIWANGDPIDLNQLMDKCKTGNSVDMLTDNRGYWMTPGFVVGGCGTSKEVDKLLADQCANFLFFALAPDGYVATTDTKVFGCDVEFGFGKDIQITPTLSEATPAQ
jgi:hypothetical protein